MSKDPPGFSYPSFPEWVNAKLCCCRHRFKKDMREARLGLFIHPILGCSRTGTVSHPQSKHLPSSCGPPLQEARIRQDVVSMIQYMLKLAVAASLVVSYIAPLRDMRAGGQRAWAELKSCSRRRMPLSQPQDATWPRFSARTTD